MGRPQWLLLGGAIFITILMFAATRNQFFGEHIPKTSVNKNAEAASAITIDTILQHAKAHLSQPQSLALTQLENGISRGDVKDQRIQAYRQLANFWADTLREFAPYAWYLGEAARLENSEKSLTFAARLFLQGLKNEDNEPLKHWEATQAKDLFERSLKLNPGNDSNKINLGAVYLYGGIDMPMKGIGMIKEVADRDSTNAYAQLTLAEASLFSNQLDKAVERFKKVIALQPSNLDALLRLAEVYEQQGDKKEAINWYKKCLPVASRIEGLQAEIQKRIALLEK